MNTELSTTLFLNCPTCNHKLRLSPEHIGVKGACIKCSTPIITIESAPGEYSIVPFDEQLSVNTSTSKADQQANHTTDPSMFSESIPVLKEQLPPTTTEENKISRNTNPFTQREGNATFDGKTHSAAAKTSLDSSEATIPDPQEFEVLNFMNVEETTKIEDSTISSFSGVSESSPEETASLADIEGNAMVVQGSLKKNKPKITSLSAPLITIIVVATLIVSCAAAFHFAEPDQKAVIKAQIAEWLEPGTVAFEKLPFGLDEKMSTFIETSLPPKPPIEDKEKSLN